VAARALLLVNMRFEPADLVARQPAGEPLHDEALDPEPHLVGVARLLPGRRCDRGAMVAPQLDKALGSELSERRPHDGAARAEALADRVLGQLRARRQRLLDDGVAQRTADRAGAVGARPGLRSRRAPAQASMPLRVRMRSALSFHTSICTILPAR